MGYRLQQLAFVMWFLQDFYRLVLESFTIFLATNEWWHRHSSMCLGLVKGLVIHVGTTWVLKVWDYNIRFKRFWRMLNAVKLRIFFFIIKCYRGFEFEWCCVKHLERGLLSLVVLFSFNKIVWRISMIYIKINSSMISNSNLIFNKKNYLLK